MQANFTNTACAHLCVRARQAEPPDATSLQARAKQLRRLRELASKLDQSTCLTPELGNSGFPTYLRTACPELLQPTFDGVPWGARQKRAPKPVAAARRWRACGLCLPSDLGV